MLLYRIWNECFIVFIEKNKDAMLSCVRGWSLFLVWKHALVDLIYAYDRTSFEGLTTTMYYYVGGSYLATPIKKLASPYHYPHYALARSHRLTVTSPAHKVYWDNRWSHWRCPRRCELMKLWWRIGTKFRTAVVKFCGTNWILVWYHTLRVRA